MRILSRLALLAATVAVAALVAQPAFSEDDPFSRPGFYLGASILGASYLTITDQFAKTLQDNLESDPSLGFNVYAGYRVHRFAAIEAQFEMLPSSDIDQSVDGTLSEVETLAGTVNAKLIAPFGRFQPYLLAGVGVADIENQPTAGINVWVSDTEVIGRFGGGADFYVTEHVVIHTGAEYVLPGGDLDNFDYISYGGGLQYRF